MNPKALLALIAALLALAFVRVPLPVAGPVPALWLVLFAELAALAVITCGIARSLGWDPAAAWR
jgi:hypothetical protein